MKAILGAISRWGLTGLGAGLATISADEVQQVIGAGATLISLVWSIYEKIKRPKQ